MEVYATTTDGTGGTIKASVEDFIVEEVLVDNTKADINGSVPNRIIGSTTQRQRYLLCMLIKRHWDTFLAIKNIAKALQIEQKRVQFAGIKDAKAVTAQYITLENILIEEAQKIVLKDIKVVPVGYIREILSLFYLLGNNFTITIKNMEVPEVIVKDRIEQTINEIESLGGIPNFFGHQRFGTTRPITHIVGKALVQGKFEEAAMLFLANPTPHEHPESKKARQELESTGDFKSASKNFPKQLRFEHLMLSHLAENPTDFIGAFQRLPPKLQALFVQAHQSYLFNRFLSGRLKHGLPANNATLGDFVVGVERSGLPLTNVVKTVDSENISQLNDLIKTGKARVALPIFGVKQKLSDGAMGQIEREILSQEGIEEKNLRFNILSRVGGKGSLRTAIAPVKNFGHQPTSDSKNSEDTQVKLSFMLFRGCYATVLLREIIKPIDPLTAGF